jgi:hypothetical protein
MSRHRIAPNRRGSPNRSDWHALRPVWALCAGLVLLLIIGIVREYLAERPQKSDIPVAVVGHDQDLHLDPAKMRPSELHLFEANSSGQKVKFIVQRSKDGAIHTALASCRNCYRSHDSHYAKRGQMMCGKCNEPMAFESDRQAGTNSCALVNIPHTETDHDITVLAHDVLFVAAKQPQ